MMEASELTRFIKQEIQRQLNVVLYGVSGNATHEAEDIQQMFPDMPTVEKRPVMHPYGIVSKAPDGKLSVNVRVGDHFGNRLVVGHRDATRPNYLATGEVVLYNEFGQQVYLKDGSIHIGSKAAAEPAVLGTVFKTLMTNLLTQLAAETHVGNLGYPTSVPQNAAQYNSLKSSPVGDSAVLSDTIFVEKG